MTAPSALADAPTTTTAPAAKKSLGWISVAYFPKKRQRQADGEPFTAHDLAIRYSYRSKDGQIEHLDMTIPRRQALNLAECLRDVYVQSYEAAPQTEPEEE